MNRKVFLLICMFVLVVSASFATRTTREEITCPLCETKFMASVVLSTNTFGGTDHDLCPHAIGASPLSNYIWGCPYCNFCGYSRDFKKEYSSEEKTKLLNWLKENYPPTIEKPVQEKPKEDEDEPNYARNQYRYDQLPSHKRYEIAAKLAKLNNKSNYEIGKLYLSATWCSRAYTAIDNEGKPIESYEISSLIEGRDNPIIQKEFEDTVKRLDHFESETMTMADLFLKIADKIEKIDINDEKEKLSCYCTMAVNLRSSGENTKAEVFIKKAESCKDADKVSKLFEGLRNSINLERSYQKKVIEYLTASLNDNLSNEQRMEVNLLLGEMNRRLENYEEATKYYQILLQNSVQVPELFMRTIKFAYENMGLNDKKFNETLDIIEKTKITASFMKLGMNPYDKESVYFLRFSKKRDIIYPELVSTINELTNKDKTYEKMLANVDPRIKSEIINNMLMAMSDETEEAAKFQYELLDTGLEERIILRNLLPLASYLPSEKFIKRFKEAKTTDELVIYISFLKIIRDKASFEALMEKAEELFTEEHLKNLGLDKEPENRNTRVYEALLDSMHMFKGEKTINFLVKLSENTLKVYRQLKKEMPEGKRVNHSLIDIYEKSGIALETMFFRHFGFSRVFERKLNPKKLETVLLMDNENNYEEAINNFKKCYEKHKKEDYKEIINSGFKEYGFDVFPASDPKKLYNLFDGLTDQLPAARVQCYKELVRRTGIMNHPESGLSTEFQGRESREQMHGFYSKWIDENIDKLVYDENAKKFIIKK